MTALRTDPSQHLVMKMDSVIVRWELPGRIVTDVRLATGDSPILDVMVRAVCEESAVYQTCPCNKTNTCTIMYVRNISCGGGIFEWRHNRSVL